MFIASNRNMGRKICECFTTQNLCLHQQSSLGKWCQESSERFLFSAPWASNPEHFPSLLTSQKHAFQQQRLGKSIGWNTKGQILDWHKSLWPPKKATLRLCCFTPTEHLALSLWEENKMCLMLHAFLNSCSEGLLQASHEAVCLHWKLWKELIVHKWFKFQHLQGTKACWRTSPI